MKKVIFNYLKSFSYKKNIEYFLDMEKKLKK